MAHKVFIVFLLFIGITAALALGIRGFSYYATPVAERPFRPDYEIMKASSNYSISLGALGASMVTLGVITYSVRKRVRALWNLGPLSGWLEFHIFLCLLGPVLVVYHTTFKAGGIAAISLWSMISVAASGIVGRFLYIMIPRNVKGGELSESQITSELSRMGNELSQNETGRELLRMIDRKFSEVAPPKGLADLFSALARLRSKKKEVIRDINLLIRGSSLRGEMAHHFHAIAQERAGLMQKTVALSQVGRIFYYWHAVHLPFTVIMFITLALHITVVTLLGYSWQL